MRVALNLQMTVFLKFEVCFKSVEVHFLFYFICFDSYSLEIEVVAVLWDFQALYTYSTYIHTCIKSRTLILNSHNLWVILTKCVFVFILKYSTLD